MNEQRAADFPHTIAIQVAFRDLDPMGHVNNAVYLSYLETARIAYITELLGLHSLNDIPIILGELTISYRSSALYNEWLTIGSGVSHFGSRSFGVVHRIDAGDGRLIAVCKTTLVMFDYAAGRTVPVPDAFRQRVAELQGDWRAPNMFSRKGD